MRILILLLIIFLGGSGSIHANEAIDFELFYYQELDTTVNNSNILSKSFEVMPNSFSNGYNNGIYWYKLVVDRAIVDEKYIAYLPTHNISKIEAFRLNNDKLDYIGLSGNSLKREELAFDYKFPAFKINQLNQKKNIFYFKVTFPKEANFPLIIRNESDFLNNALVQQSLIFLYYGTCLIAVLLCLFLFYRYRHITFIYYSMFLFSVAGGMMLYDGSLINLQRLIPFGNNLEFLLRVMECSTLILFSINFLELRHRIPAFVKVSYVFPFFIVFSYLLYLITGKYIAIAIGDVLGISIFAVFWGIGFYYIKRLLYAKFFVLGYSLILPVGVFFFVGYGFGWWSINGENVFVKIAGWFDLIVFTYALSYRVKVREIENEKMVETLKTQLREMGDIENDKTSLVDQYYIFLKENDFTSEPLTIREIEVLKFLNEGSTNNQIAEQLFISNNTVKTHIRKIYNKLNIKDRDTLKEKVSEAVSL